VLAAVLVAVWLSRLLIPDSLTRHLSLFFALIAAEIPIGLAFYRLSRKSVNRHVVLWFTAICALLAVGFLGPLDRLPEDWQGLTVLLTGLALGAVVAVGVTRLEKAGRTGPLAAPEVAWFSWWVNNPGGVGALALCLIFLAVASAALIGGIPVRPSVVVIIGLVAVLPHETVCWFRAKGLERRGRSHTVGLLALGLLSAASGVRPVLSASGAGVGLLIGLAALAFIRARSK
jgi:hypothetical protein